MIASGLESAPSFSQVDLAQASPTSLLSTAGSPAIGVQADNGLYNEYTVYPLTPQKIADIGSAVRTYAASGTVRIVSSANRPEFENILYWQFEATASAARRLKAQLGSDVSTCIFWACIQAADRQ